MYIVLTQSRHFYTVQLIISNNNWRAMIETTDCTSLMLRYNCIHIAFVCVFISFSTHLRCFFAYYILHCLLESCQWTFSFWSWRCVLIACDSNRLKFNLAVNFSIIIHLKLWIKVFLLFFFVVVANMGNSVSFNSIDSTEKQTIWNQVNFKPTGGKKTQSKRS